MLVFGSQLAMTSLASSDRAALDWARANTPEDGQFLVLTGEPSVFCDATQEWFPALTGRMSVTTVQGLEWAGGEKFATRLRASVELQACLSDGAPLACLEQKSHSLGINYDYIYIRRIGDVKSYCRTIGRTIRGQQLISDLRQDAGYNQAYATEAVVVFVRQSGP